MNPKLLAIKRTIIILLIIVAMPILLHLFFLLPIEMITWIGTIVLVSFFIWLIYSINLSSIKHEIALKESYDRLQAIIDGKKD